MEEYIKLNIKDIAIKSPGQQVKALIVEKYGSIEAFSEKIGLYSISVKQYLSNKNLGSSTFKIKLTNELNMNFEDMYRTEEEQISSYVADISQNIEKYNQNKDEQVIEKLKNICFEREMLDDYISMCRSYGIYYYNQNKFDRALAYMELVINYLRNRKNMPELLLSMSETARAYAKTQTREKFQQTIASMNKSMKSIGSSDGKYLYNIYYNMGSSYSYAGDYETAIEMYENSLEYAKDNSEKAMPEIQIAHQLRVLGRLDDSIRYYRRACRYLEGHEREMNKIYRGFALIYMEKGDYVKAGIFADKMFNGISGHISSTENDYVYIFAVIKLRLGQVEEVIDKIQELLDEVKLDYIYTAHHIEWIGRIIQNAPGNNEFLKRLMGVFIENIRENVIQSDEIVSKLKTFIGEIVIIMGARFACL